MDAEQQPSLPQTKLTLHWQRLIILVASIVGISSLFLPWVHFPTGETITQTGEDSAITAAVFLLPLAVALIGARTPPLSVVARWFTVIPGGLLVAYAVARGIFTRDIFLSTAGESPVAQAVARSTSAGIGPFVCFFAGAGIIIASFLARRPKQPVPPLPAPLLPLVRPQASKIVTPRWADYVAVFAVIAVIAFAKLIGDHRTKTVTPDVITDADRAEYAAKARLHSEPPTTFSGDSANAPPDATSNAEPTPETQTFRVHRNEEFRLGDCSYKITTVRVEKALGGRKAPKGAIYFTVNLLIRNDGKQTEEINLNECALVDLQGRSFSPSFSSTVAASRDSIPQEYQAGFFKKGDVTFEIPEESIKANFKIGIPDKTKQRIAILSLTAPGNKP